MKGPDAYEIVGNKIKVKYQSLQWNQHKPQLDVFEDIEKVKAYCGDDAICWLDTYHWSLMNKTKLTEDIYQFISHRAGVFRRGFSAEADRMQAHGINPEPLIELKQALIMQLKNGLIDFIDLI